MVGWRERSESLLLVSSSSRRCDYALCLPQHSSWGDKGLLSDSVIRSANIEAQSVNCGQLMQNIAANLTMEFWLIIVLLISDQDGCDVFWGQKGDMIVMVLWHINRNDVKAREDSATESSGWTEKLSVNNLTNLQNYLPSNNSIHYKNKTKATYSLVNKIWTEAHLWHLNLDLLC